MLEDFRFWSALFVLFLSASLFSVLSAKLRKNSIYLRAFFFLLPSLISLCLLWIFLPAGTSLYQLFSMASLVMAVFGILLGFFPFLVPLPFLIPFILSLVLNAPLRSLVEEDQPILGRFQFYPSNEGDISVLYSTSDGFQSLYSLEGESLSFLIQKSELSHAYFFFQDQSKVLLMSTQRINPSDLPSEDSENLIWLSENRSPNSYPYKISFPAVKFIESDFFGLYEIQKKDQSILIVRK